MKCVNVNKKILIVAIVILCVFAVFSFTMVSNAEEVTVVGTWDISKDNGTSKVTATLYSDGRFVISGTGEMKDFSGDNRPYGDYKKSIKTVEIQNEVTSIGNYAFENCKSLTSIEISSNVTIIGDDAFAYCTNLTSIEIPSSVTSIGSSAFLDCTNLTSIEIPSSVTSVGYYAFSECTSLNSINVDKSNQKYSSEDGILFDKDKKELIRYPTGKKEKEYNIPSSVTRIEWAAFSGCTSLTSIEIPSSVTSIGFAAFGSCTNLTRIEIPSSVTRIGSSAFHSCTSLTRIEIQSSVTSIKIEGGAFAYCTSLTNIEIPSGVTSIGNAFYGCTSLNSINVDKDNQLYSSEDGILFDKVKTKLITYPAGKKEKEYNIPSGVTSIGGWAFYGCTSLTRIEIPSSITSIGGWAFSGCTSLTSIEIPSSVTSIGGYAFDRAKLTMVVVAESKNVQEIELPDIIKRAMNKGDILYTSSDFELTNCSLTEDKTKLEVASKETVRLKVKEGALSGISVVVKVVSLKKYEVTEENGEVYIEDINPGTKIQEFIDNIETNGTMKFYKGNSEITDVNSKVQTGMIMKITLGEQETSCKLIVRGDLNGDGEMGDIDLLKLVRYQAGLDTSLNGAYLKAADVYKDGTYADNKDLLKMARVLAGLDSL